MFSNVVYLNRDQDTERKEITEAQLFEYGIEATRFSALDDGLLSLMHQSPESLRISFAQASCLISHLEIIRKYGSKDLLVFEDDIDLSTSDYWGEGLQGILDVVDSSVGIVQLSYFPNFPPVLPRWWQPGTFGTAAYFIRPWYSNKLVELGYRDGRWDISAFRNKYSQPLADSVLYSNTPTLSLSLFGTRPVPSTILPHATYTSDAALFSRSWAEGKNNINEIKAALPKFKC